MKKYKNITGENFGKWTAIEKDVSTDGPYWLCICECGCKRSVVIYDLINEKSKSCGCVSSERMANAARTHGMSSTRFIRIWRTMLRRCYETKFPQYDNYGGRGIIVCEDWHDFNNFKNDMFDTYNDWLSIDRIDVNGNYCKENCRWVNYSTQAYNKRKVNTNTSGRTGVSFHNKMKKWAAKITKDKKQIHLGYYNEFEDAVKARESAELYYYGVNKE